MKTIILMRHAKSSWKQTDLSDHERPLNKRGKKNAPLMGKLLKDNKLQPDLILSSSAVRAKATAEAVVKASHYKGEVTYSDALYLAEVNVFFELMKTVSDEAKILMIVGHNPGLESLVQIIGKEIVSLPTASIAQIEIPIKSWSEIDQSCRGELINLWRPCDLKKQD